MGVCCTIIGCEEVHLGLTARPVIQFGGPGAAGCTCGATAIRRDAAGSLAAESVQLGE